MRGFGSAKVRPKATHTPPIESVNPRGSEPTSVRTLGRVCPTHSALLEWPAPLEVRSSEPMHERLEEADYADDETDYAEDEKPAQIGT